jgi:hypothetical protein
MCPHCSLCANFLPKPDLWKEWIVGVDLSVYPYSGTHICILMNSTAATLDISSQPLHPLLHLL